MDSESVCVGNHAVLHAIQRAIHATNPYQFDNSWKHNLIINAQTHGFMEIDFNLYFLYMYRHTIIMEHISNLSRPDFSLFKQLDPSDERPHALITAR